MPSKLKNQYSKYWLDNGKDWHEKNIGTYHVSGVGCKQDDNDPDSHYGPCKRQTQYEYTFPIPKSLTSQGNVHTGTNHHALVQDIFRKNHNNSIIEFPLHKMDVIGNEIIHMVGSIDAIIMDYDFTDDITYIDVYDFKTASKYTLPKHDKDYNPTYFSQLYLYGFILESMFSSVKVRIRNLFVVYIDKHNLSTYEIVMPYELAIAMERFNSFKERCWLLHMSLTLKRLADKDPNRWCKYCSYKTRCDLGLKKDPDMNKYTNDELADIFVGVSGKKAFWGNRETNGFKEWKKRLIT